MAANKTRLIICGGRYGGETRISDRSRHVGGNIRRRLHGRGFRFSNPGARRMGYRPQWSRRQHDPEPFCWHQGHVRRLGWIDRRRDRRRRPRRRGSQANRVRISPRTASRKSNVTCRSSTRLGWSSPVLSPKAIEIDFLQTSDLDVAPEKPDDDFSRARAAFRPPRANHGP